MKTAEYIVMLSSRHDSPFILVLCVSRSSRNSDRVTPCGAAKQRWGVKISQFSTNNLLYLNKKDSYRQLNVRQLGSLHPWDHRGKCYMARKRIQCLLNASRYVPIYGYIQGIYAFHSNHGRICSHFGDIHCQRMA